MAEFISLAGLRIDGRRENEIRRIRTRMGLFGKVDGSAYYEQGNTKIVAVVHGPWEAHRGAQMDVAAINCEFSQAEFATSERRAARGFDRRRTEYSLALQQTFEAAVMRHLYPRTQIDISVEVLHADGGVLSACVNAVTLALIDAGIALRDFVVSCSSGYIEQTLMTDLNGQEQNANAPDLTIGYMPKNEKVNLVHMECKLPIKDYEKLMEQAIQGCDQIAVILKQAVRDRTLKLVASREAY